MNVVHYNYAVAVNFSEQEVRIMQHRLVTMVGINQRKVNLRHVFQCGAKGFVNVSANDLDAGSTGLFKMQLCHVGQLGHPSKVVTSRLCPARYRVVSPRQVPSSTTYLALAQFASRAYRAAYLGGVVLIFASSATVRFF